MIKLFITATDTDAGKTYVSRALIRALVDKLHLKVAAFKPISAGCELSVFGKEQQLINEDALLLSKEANVGQSVSSINPIAFKAPIAPHIAAKQLGKAIRVSAIIQYYTLISASTPDVTVTEGAGGWRLPLGDGDYLSDFVAKTEQFVILVVNMKLGCLNHAVLTFESILHDGLTCIGWVANCNESMDFLDENIEELSQLLPIPMLAKLPKEHDIAIAADQFNLTPIKTL